MATMFFTVGNNVNHSNMAAKLFTLGNHGNYCNQVV
jgi:hypothetical protein